MDRRLIGTSVRALRHKHGWRQEDLALKAGVSRGVVSRVERGLLANVSLGKLERVCEALGAQYVGTVRWTGADLDRLLDARHAALADAVTAFVTSMGWAVVPEATFSIFGERGSIDLLAWHLATRTLLVIELKTELVEIDGLVSGVDRERRLAPAVAAERGWKPATVAAWVVLSPGRTNARRLAEHAPVLRAAFPDDGRSLRPWLGRPSGPLAALSFLPDDLATSTKKELCQRRRVRRRIQPDRAA
jgi:transcriptional regulator with XRE-family HTH domain